MASVYESIDESLTEWIERQRMFFVATAPGDAGGHVNVSPKGDMATFAVLGPDRVAYLDYFGSGIETVAHLKADGRITVLFCAFEGPPRVVRLHGTGDVVEQREEAFDDLFAQFAIDEESLIMVRSIITIEVERISDSCGFTVPRMQYVGERDQLVRFAENAVAKDGENAVQDYCDINNGESIDGLPGLSPFSAEPVTAGRVARSHVGRKL